MFLLAREQLLTFYCTIREFDILYTMAPPYGTQLKFIIPV